MDDAAITAAVRDALAGRAGELGLDPAALTVEPVLNWGGFVNRSFHVHDGRVRRHLKLTAHGAQVAKLRRWHRLRDRLARDYLAPGILAWIDVPAAGLAGLLFPHIEGAVAAELSGPLRDGIVALVARLHDDRDLAAELAGEGAPATCADTFRRFHMGLLREDLRLVGASPPDFATPALLDRLRAEVDRLEAEVADDPAFAHPAASPIHGDLWLNNVMVAADGRRFVIDWDELSLGDPVHDWAMLFGPSWHDLRPATLKGVPDDALRPPGARRRLAVHARSLLLGWALDSLADFIEAGTMPAHERAVRRERRRIHQAAMELYDRLYPPGTPI